MAKVLQKVNISLNASDADALTKEISTEQVRKVVISMPNGKATGINGLPYELWKSLIQLEESEPKVYGSCTAKLLSTVYSNISAYGLCSTSDFAKGWLCPLYKKNDRHEITNYCPITLLNCNYKILTKLLALQMVSTLPKVIHCDQAGFVPGCSISDQIKLTQMIQAYAELDNDFGGVLVGLDQEKAYDKILHVQ